jgi:hypothetical protein
MKKIKIILILIASFPTISSAVSIPNEASARHEEYCKEKWSKRGVIDSEMYSFCVQQEHEGYLNLINLANKYSQYSWIQSVVDFSLNKWTERGKRDDEMAHSTLYRITEGFENIVYYSKQSNYNKNKIEFCYNKWGYEWDMVDFCYKN